MNKEGESTEDPSEMLEEGGGLLYLGGSEETGGYKGYGLGMMVEVLGGILGGGPFGKNIRGWTNTNDKKVANLVSCEPHLRGLTPMTVYLISLNHYGLGTVSHYSTDPLPRSGQPLRSEHPAISPKSL